MNAKILRMISVYAFAIAALSGIINLFMAVSLYVSQDIIWTPSLLVSLMLSLVSMILLACAAITCNASQYRKLGLILIALAVVFACSAIRSLMTWISLLSWIPGYLFMGNVIRLIANILFGISAVLGAISVGAIPTLAGKTSKNFYSVLAITALAAVIIDIAGTVVSSGGRITSLFTLSTLVAIMEGIGLFALGMNCNKALEEDPEDFYRQISVRQTTVAAPSSAELADYKQLLDQGILSQEEFNEQKKRFLQG